MQIGDVSESASGRVLLLMKKVFTRLGMPGVANHLTDHIVRKLAHFCEYALEGFLLTLCLRVYTRHFFVHISWPILGGLITALTAVLSGPVQDVLAALQTSKRGLTQ